MREAKSLLMANSRIRAICLLAVLLVASFTTGRASAQCAPNTLLRTLNNPTPESIFSFGEWVAISGNLAVVGAHGVVEVPVFNATTGALLMTLKNPASGIHFGRSVAISGTLAVVGDTAAWPGGAAYVYDVTSGALLATLRNPSTAAETMGGAVAISGNLAVVGAIGGSSGGVSYVFNAGTGGLVATLNNPNPTMIDDDEFGNAVAISGNLAVVGAWRDDPGGVYRSGSAHVFDATSGALLVTLDNPTPATWDVFGWSVAISENIAIVGATGARHDDFPDFPAGKAYVFNATTGALLAQLNDPASALYGEFGHSVAISGNLAVVGAPGKDVILPDGSAAFDTGRVCVFQATTGTFLAALDNPTPDDFDAFGSSVAISGNLAVMGAPKDSEGTAYVFHCASLPELIRDYLLGCTTTPPGVDVNGDGSVDIADLILAVAADARTP